MLPPHPFSKIPTRNLAWMFALFAVTTLIFSVLFFRWDPYLRHEGAPYGIVSFELAWSVAGIERVMDGWTESTRALALRINLYDYIYLICYSTCLSLLCLLLGRWKTRFQCHSCAHFWPQAAWWPWIAAGFDAIENTASLPLLLQTPQFPWPQVMTTAAVIKFVILAALLVLIVLSPLGFIMPRKGKPL